MKLTVHSIAYAIRSMQINARYASLIPTLEAAVKAGYVRKVSATQYEWKDDKAIEKAKTDLIVRTKVFTIGNDSDVMAVANVDGHDRVFVNYISPFNVNKLVEDISRVEKLEGIVRNWADKNGLLMWAY